MREERNFKEILNASIMLLDMFEFLRYFFLILISLCLLIIALGAS